jgi:rubrerythrin
MKRIDKKIILEEPVDEVFKTVLKEDKEEVEVKTEQPQETPATPKTQEGFGIASLLNAAIVNEFESIDLYNSQIITIKDVLTQEKDAQVIASYESIISILTEIVNEENIHVGQLQKALSLVSPNAVLIQDEEAKVEAQPEAPKEESKQK